MDIELVYSQVKEECIRPEVRDLNEEIEGGLASDLLPAMIAEGEELLHEETHEHRGEEREHCREEVPDAEKVHQDKENQEIGHCGRATRDKVAHDAPIHQPGDKNCHYDILSLMIREYLEKSIEAKSAALADKNFLENAEGAGKHIHDSLMAGKRIYIAGVGGAAAESQHFSAELLGKYKSMRKAFPAVALTTDSSMLTAWANDASFDLIFSRQLEGLGQKDDIFVAMSAGGNSPSILEALKTTKSLGMFSICLLGKGGGQARGMCDIAVVVPSDVTAHIQETHLALIHYFCESLEP